MRIVTIGETDYQIRYSGEALLKIEREIRTPIPSIDVTKLSVDTMGVFFKHGTGLNKEQYTKLSKDLGAGEFMKICLEALDEFGDEMASLNEMSEDKGKKG